MGEYADLLRIPAVGVPKTIAKNRTRIRVIRIDRIVLIQAVPPIFADREWKWWLQLRADLVQVKRLVIDLDNGPKNSGRRTQFLKRMVQFADWSGLHGQRA
jgi:hypothetical protein